MASVLDDIIVGVREDLNERQRRVSLAQVQAAAAAAPPARDALSALRTPQPVHIFAEVKRASPSKGALADIPEPAALAAAYERGGASVISVLTEQRRFRGSLADLDAVRAAVDIPVLRKDFMVEEYQFYEARAHGADVILLIVAALDDGQLRDFAALTKHLGMAALVEVHNIEEAERACAVGADIFGVNARNLKTLEVHPEIYAGVAKVAPPTSIKVAESGIAGPQDAFRYVSEGANALLIGEALVRDGEPEKGVRAILDACAQVPTSDQTRNHLATGPFATEGAQS